MRERKNNKYFVNAKEFKETKNNPFIAAVLSFFFGIFGAHRFYLKRKITGAILLITLVFAVSKDIPALVLVLILLSFVEGIFYIARGVLLLIEKHTEEFTVELDVAIKKHEINKNTNFEIIDVSDIKPIKIPREKEIENTHHNQWIRKLELHYERNIMAVGQVKDETIKFYEKLCTYLDDEIEIL